MLFGILATYDPWPVMTRLGALRANLFRGQFIPQAFHASEDRQAVRDEVFKVIREWGDFAMHVLVLEKAGAPPSHRDQAAFYSFAADLSLRRVLVQHPKDEPIFVVTDTLPFKGKRDAVVKGFKASLVAILQNRRFQIEHHTSGSQPCLQVVDYLTWALFRKWERSDLRSYGLISEFVVQEVNFNWSLIQQR
jgi:hypothetical protein